MRHTKSKKNESLLDFVNRRIEEIRFRDGTPEHIEHWNDLIEIKEALEATNGK